MLQNYTNPIIRGFHPDPSVCRVGDEFFLVTSSFEYFPGVPIYKSTNLVNWSCIGHCLTRSSQLPLENCHASEGIYAPTIRYHKGRFYMVTTNVSEKGNFIVSTEDIYGEWSEPAWIDQGGIDPSLLFADDKVYFASNEDDHGNRGIYMCEIDPMSGTKLSDSKLISKGCGGRFPEAPHVYKINDMYYLMLAEGGTEYGHMVTIQRSCSPYGPYEACPHNPILSQRESESMDICCVGHADMVEDQNGNWWMVALGTRAISYRGRQPMLHNLGRETFLAPVVWQNGWPVPGNHGTLELTVKANLPAPVAIQYPTRIHTFESLISSHAFTYIRNPDMSCYQFQLDQNRLTLYGTQYHLSAEGKSPTFIGIRQTSFSMVASVQINTTQLTEHGKAGISAFYNHEHHYDLLIEKRSEDFYVVLRKRIYDIEVNSAEMLLENQKSFVLTLKADSENYYFYYRENEEDILLDQGTTAALCTEITRQMTFTGTFIGLFAENTTATFEQLKVLFQP